MLPLHRTSKLTSSIKIWAALEGCSAAERLQTTRTPTLSRLSRYHLVTASPMASNRPHWAPSRKPTAANRADCTDRNPMINQTGSSMRSSHRLQQRWPTPACGTENTMADVLLGYYRSVGVFVPAPFSKAG